MTDAVGADRGDIEITARFERDELVRGWAARSARLPSVVPRLNFGLKTDLGRVRENNEDKAEFYVPDDPALIGSRGYLFTVADGMGGHKAGQIASEIATKVVAESYYESTLENPMEALIGALRDANDRVYAVASGVADRAGMGTTFTAAAFVEDTVYVGHIGDSRAYLIRDGVIRQVSEDHSWVREQVRLGSLTREQAVASPYRNVITRCIGAEPVAEPDGFRECAMAGDTWLLCSDGLTGHVENHEILDITGSRGPSEACRQLVTLASARGGRDNITVVVVRVVSIDPWSLEATTET